MDRLPSILSQQISSKGQAVQQGLPLAGVRQMLTAYQGHCWLMRDCFDLGHTSGHAKCLCNQIYCRWISYPRRCVWKCCRAR